MERPDKKIACSDAQTTAIDRPLRQVDPASGCRLSMNGVVECTKGRLDAHSFARGDPAADPPVPLRACVQRSLAGPHLAPAAEPVAPAPLTISAFGKHLHAATNVGGRDRQQLERLCRYLLRPPFAHDAVQALPDGRVRVHFKAPWRRGIAHADMDKDKFLARLCALVPPPGFHMVRYFGVLASHHHLRPRVVPGRDAELPGQQLPLDFTGRDSAEPKGPPESKAPRRIGWASLLARVFAIDVTV